ncbi:MAG: APC family permease [Propionibacteriaceae bacterium]|nr:APC family permease [Propionibacteriaceae bacterium]
MTAQHAALARRLSLPDAVFIGLGSMIGAGVFAVWAPAVQSAGAWLLVGLAIALVVAFCNATASAQLAAQYPTSGGTYVYGRERLGHWPGFLAGWGFVVGKTASIAAMALTFGHYVFGPAAKWIAVAIVLVLAGVNSLGVTRTARLTRIIVSVVLAVLALVVLANALGGPRVFPADQPAVPVGDLGVYGLLQSAGLLFFAFAGYARIATMGEEVKDPRRAIPRAILISLVAVAIVYAVVGVLLLRRIPAEILAVAEAPLAFAVAYSPLPMLTPIVAAAAALATVGAMLNLMTGVGRTTLAMARNNDLPRWLARVDQVHSVPRNAEIVLAIIVCALVLASDVRVVIGFSSFGVLVYYLIANIAAFTQDAEHRRYPRGLQIVGAIACGVLVVTLPFQAVILGVAVYLVGAAYRLVRRPDRAPAPAPGGSGDEQPEPRPRRSAD